MPTIGRGHRLQRAVEAVIGALWREQHHFDGIRFVRFELWEYSLVPGPPDPARGVYPKAG